MSASPRESGPAAARVRWFQLEVPSDPAALPWVSHSLRGFLRAAGWTRRDAFRVDLATNEALDNAIRHGNRRQSALTVELRVRDDGGRVCVEVTDRGQGFDLGGLQTLQSRNIELAEGGRGVALMRHLMDEVEVERGPRGACVRMTRVRRETHALPQAG